MASCQITKNQINLDLIKIIHLWTVLDIFLDILLKPPQPLMGLFFTHTHTQLISRKAKYRLKVAAVRRQWSRGELPSGM